MVSPFKVNESLAHPEKGPKVFLDKKENKPDKDGNEINVTMNKKIINLLLDVIPPIRNHVDRHFNMNDPEDIETVADLEQLYQELIELKKEFQLQKEK